MQNLQTLACIMPGPSADYLITSLLAKQFKLLLFVEDKNKTLFKPLEDPNVQIYELKDFESLEKLADFLKQKQVLRIVNGDDNFVNITEKLTHLVCPEFSNPCETLTARSNKYELHEALKTADLPHIKQVLLTKDSNLEKLPNFAFPVIIKPKNGTATVGVQICNNLEDVKNYLSSQCLNICGIEVTEFILQELLIGEEYFIDTFSYKGKHFVSCIQKYYKERIDGVPICLSIEVVDINDPVAQVLMDYIFSVLNTIKYHNGMAHSEIMLTANGPRVIEVNPRISGGRGAGPKTTKYSNYPTHLDLLETSIRNPSALTTIPQIFEKVHGIAVTLLSFKEKNMGELNEKLLKTLPSYQETICYTKPGDLIKKPKNLWDSVAFVLLSNLDLNQLKKDYNQVQRWNQEDILF